MTKNPSELRLFEGPNRITNDLRSLGGRRSPPTPTCSNAVNSRIYRGNHAGSGLLQEPANQTVKMLIDHERLEVHKYQHTVHSQPLPAETSGPRDKPSQTRTQCTGRRPSFCPCFEKVDGADPWLGYELHAVVETREVTWSDGIERVTIGPPVPPVITHFALTPAGSHRADAIVPELVAAKESGDEVNEVVWDRGYSQLRPQTHSFPLNRAGIDQTFQPMDYQRPPRPFRSDAVVIEGQLFSTHLPKELWNPLPMPPLGASVQERQKYERLFNYRARFRFTRHAGPDANGMTRWRCPWCSGLLRSRSLPKTMRKSRNAPLVELPPGVRCCNGTLTVAPEDLPFWQRLSPGTTAWRKSMGRRQNVENANSLLKGGFVNLERKFIRVFRLPKLLLLLAFSIAGVNVDVIRSFRAKTGRVESRKSRRAKRRRGTWTDLLGPLPPASGRSPPQA